MFRSGFSAARESPGVWGSGCPVGSGEDEEEEECRPWRQLCLLLSVQTGVPGVPGSEWLLRLLLRPLSLLLWPC